MLSQTAFTFSYIIDLHIMDQSMECFRLICIRLAYTCYTIVSNLNINRLVIANNQVLNLIFSLAVSCTRRRVRLDATPLFCNITLRQGKPFAFTKCKYRVSDVHCQTRLVKR